MLYAVPINLLVTWHSLLYINNVYSTAIAWSPHHHGLLASGGGTADRCIRFWNTLTGQPMQCVDTGSQVCNLAWSKHSSELVSFLCMKVVFSFVFNVVLLTKVRILILIWNRWWNSCLNLFATCKVKLEIYLIVNEIKLLYIWWWIGWCNAACFLRREVFRFRYSGILFKSKRWALLRKTIIFRTWNISWVFFSLSTQGESSNHEKELQKYISGFHHSVVETFAVLGYCTA